MGAGTDESTWLSWLVRARFFVITAALGIELAVLRFSAAVVVPLTLFLSIIVTWYTVAVFFILLRALWKDVRRQARIQIAADLLFATAIIYVTGGGLDTAFNFVYPVLIIVAAMVLPRLWAYGTALAAFILYGAILELSYFDVIRSYGITHPDPKWLLTLIFVNLFAYLAIAYLATNLSAKLRQANVELEDASGALENLQAVHEHIIHSMHGGLITTDLGGNITLLNAPGQNILGRTAKSVYGKPVQELFMDPLPSGAAAPLNREVRSVTPEQQEKVIGITVTPLLMAHGETVGYVYTFADLTNIKRLEREVRLRDRLSAVGRMAAGIAHEIRNPLSSIVGSVKLLSRMSDLSGEQTSLVNIVTRESERLNGIIGDFLSYTREKSYRFTETDLVALLQDTLTLLENRDPVTSGRIKVARQIAVPEAPAMADGDRMKQVFWNLAENAFRAMPEGGTLTVSLKAEDASWNITFGDTGCGMSAAQMEKLFEPFQSHFDEGTGFGLAIVYQIVQSHHAQISVHSEPGKGAEFSILMARLERRARARSTPREELSEPVLVKPRSTHG